MQNYTKGLLYASGTALLWGFLAIALKVASQKVDSVTIVWFRFLVASIALYIWQARTNPSSFKILKRPPWLLILAAVGLSWNYIGFMFGIQYTTPSNAQLFVQTGPVILTIAGLVIFKEKLKTNQIIGFALTIVGFAFFYRDQLFAFFESQDKYNLGVSLTLSGSIAWATYAVSQKKLVVKYSSESLNLFIFGFPVLVLLPFIDITPLLQLRWDWWILMILLGGNTLVAYSFLPKALKFLEASRVSIILIVNPMITFITMGILTQMNVSWITHERFSMVTILGAALVFTGAVFVVWRKKKKMKS